MEEKWWERLERLAGPIDNSREAELQRQTSDASWLTENPGEIIFSGGRQGGRMAKIKFYDFFAEDEV